MVFLDNGFITMGYIAGNYRFHFNGNGSSVYAYLFHPFLENKNGTAANVLMLNAHNLLRVCDSVTLLNIR